MAITTDRALRTAAFGFACTVGFCSVVAMRDDLPGQPLRIRIPLLVPAGLLVGWGAGVAAPWPMPVAALMAAARAGDPKAGAWPAIVCTGLGIASTLGFLIEPNTYDPKSWTPATCTAIALGFAASGSLAATGFRQLMQSRRTQADRGAR